MTKQTNSGGWNWPKKLFEANFFFSNILFPVNVLVFYILSFLILLSRIFHIWQGVSYNFIVRSWRWTSYSAAGIFLIFTFILMIRNGEKLVFDNAKEKVPAGDYLLLLLPLTPVIQYVLNNQRILSFLDSVLIVGFFLGVSIIFTFVVPAIFGKVGSIRILVPLGLSFIFTMSNMALLTQSNNWYDIGSFKIQWLVFGTVFLGTWFLSGFNRGNLLRLIIVVFFTSNTIMQLINLNSLETEKISSVEEIKISTSVEENKLLTLVEGRTPTTTPNVYLLIYDAYVANETMLGYGIDNSAQEKLLVESGFTLYPHTYSIGFTTLGTMSRVLNASEDFYGSPRRAVAGDGIVQNLFQSYGYQTYGLFPYDYMFRGESPSYDFYSPEYVSSSVKLILSAILMGEFRFDHGFDVISRDQFVETKQGIFEEVSERGPVFIYMHSKLPSHSQNSGSCRPDETDRYEGRLADANIEMMQDIRIILENDPGAIIIVAGDHGPYLSKNCTRNVTFEVSEMTRLDIQDRVGTFLAIRWPTQDFEAYDDITVLQDLFPAVFAYLYSDASILDSKIEPITITNLIDVNDGVIIGGIDDGEPLFLSE